MLSINGFTEINTKYIYFTCVNNLKQIELIVFFFSNEAMKPFKIII